MTIQEIKQRVSMNQVLEYYDLKPRNGMIHCPFHEDKTPSMQVFEDSNTVRCYSGNCSQSGKVIDVIDFIMYKEGLSKHQAIVKAGERAGESGNKSETPVRSREYRELPKENLEEIFTQMKTNLKQSPAAQEYALQRCLNPEKLELGYNGRTYKGLINCLVFPLRDPTGKVVSLYGRSIKDKGHFYLKDRRGLYPQYPVKSTKKLILTESIIDAASLLPIKEITDHYEVLACYGTNGFTREHREVIADLKQLEELIFMFDADEAGKKATEKYAQEVKKEYPHLKISEVELPSKDSNETLQLHTPEIFTELLNLRKDFLFSSENPSPEARGRAGQRQETEVTKNYTLPLLNELIGQSGIVGEENSRLLLFIIASSYKTKNPLHALVQGSSGSGKTHLISKIADLLPQENVLRFTRITESSLYNWGEWDLVGKLMVIEDLDGLKEEALYSLRELISSQMVSSSVSIKDKKGNIKSVQKKVRGLFSSLSATTQGDIYEDNISRSFILAVDESSAQSRKIIQYQNQKYAGQISKEQEYKAKEELREFLRNLQDWEVINPYAPRLELPPQVHKIRRLNEMYQSIIRQITYLNQKNRKLQNGKLLTEIEDLHQATEILFESILLKIDELDGSLRQFYERLKKYIKHKEKEFTQREIRQAVNLSKAQCSRFINTLQSLEYIVSKNNGNLRKISYKIDYWDDFEKLRHRIKTELQNQIEKLK